LCACNEKRLLWNVADSVDTKLFILKAAEDSGKLVYVRVTAALTILVVVADLQQQCWSQPRTARRRSVS